MKKLRWPSIILFSFFSHYGQSQTAIYHHGWIDFNKNGKKDIFEDAAQPIEQRVEDLFGQMTLQEKLAQVRSLINRSSQPLDLTKSPIGHLGNTVYTLGPAAGARFINDHQKQQIERTRLGIPLLFFEEALHGLCADSATSFPQAIALASTWNPELIGRVSVAIAEETRSRGIHQVLSPVVDIARDPRWGRAQETYGEDPYLVSRMAVAFCKSFEERNIITTPKHFVANSGEGGRDSWAMDISERLLEEIYFPPYKACIREAGSRSIMPSYNSLNGVPTICDPWLLTEKAREEWGFTGFFGADFSAVTGIKDRHYLTNKDEEVAALALNAGMDVEWPNALFYLKPLETAIATGLVATSTLDESVKRILRLKMEIGLFENPFADEKKAIQINDSKDHRTLARQAARQGLVLLKNESQTLPFDTGQINTIAVIGNSARNQQLGNYSGTGMKKVSLLEGLSAFFPSQNVLFHPGIQSASAEWTAFPGNLISQDGNAGFRADYYSNRNLEGAPAATLWTNLAQIRWAFWARNVPEVITRQDQFSARFTGTFAAPATMTARFQLETPAQMRLLINGREVINTNGNSGKPFYAFEATAREMGLLNDVGHPKFLGEFLFEVGKTYVIQLEFQSAANTPFANFFWDQRVGVEDDIKAAVAMAAKADAVIVLPGGISEGEFRDRPDIDLPEEEELLLRSLAALNKPMAVVLVNGAAIGIADWERDVPAILESWYSGEEGGNAIAETLMGVFSPGGKLPVTFPLSSAHSPRYYNYKAIGRSRGFQDPDKGRTMFPFGHGLSYTSFGYSNLMLDKKVVKQGESLTVSLDVKNAGAVAGDEVVQLYLHSKYASVIQPVIQLKGFKRIHLGPGEQKRIAITLSSEDLSIWNRDVQLVMEPRPVLILIGSSSEDIRLTGEVDIVK